MTSSKVAILDVGHGNSAVIIDQHGTTVIDAGLGGTLMNFLNDNHILHVENVLISHADTDHIAGLIGLLASDSVDVRHIYLNPDPVRKSKIWDDLKSVLKEARTKRGTVVKNGLSTTIPGELNTGDFLLQVVAPTPELALSGVGATLGANTTVTAHSLNAVVLLRKQNKGIVLFPGDIDDLGLGKLRDEGTDIRAEVLVFPHHGGLPGKDATGFATSLCQMVKPEIVVFSIGRGRHNTPRTEVVSAVKAASPGVHVACTQLSERCASTLPTSPPLHLSIEASLGKEKNQCCAGTLVVLPLPLRPILADHSAFVDIAAPTAVCRTKTKGSAQPKTVATS